MLGVEQGQYGYYSGPHAMVHAIRKSITRKLYRSFVMATFILVHGGNMSTEGWNLLTNRNTYPLGGQLGGRIWDGTIAMLREHGHVACAPTLADEHTHNLTDHIEQICRLIEDQDLKNILLVGHSYGGMVITGVTARMPKRVRRLVYIDAAVPDPGQSLFNQFAEGGVNPLTFAGFEAASAYVEKLPFDPRTIQRLSKTYILCTESEFAVVTRVARRKVARQTGWIYHELPMSHVPMATMPKRFYQLMLSFAQ